MGPTDLYPWERVVLWILKDISLYASLSQINGADQRNNLATVSAYFDVWWTDEFLVWNTTDFDGIERVFIPVKWIWKPEFYMYHRSALIYL
uniref:Neur_chan_LBD domain-containing protein n=1 Tax=Heterorhabditis bacteriophora TaxID=37862 RepID=A0A1I7XEG8_HETBA